MQPVFTGLQSVWMKLRWLYLAVLVALPIGASTIDISSETSTLVRTGDSLVFHLFTWNFGVNAAAFGLPSNPTDISFAFVSSPLDETGNFAATLESADRTVSVAFGNPAFNPGTFQGSQYTGEVSTLEGYLHLAQSLSETLFGAPSAVIALRNDGADITVGLEPYLLRQNLFASLSGGPLSVGAIPGWVELERQESGARFMLSRGAMSFAAPSEVPEPGSGALLFGGGVLLCGLSLVMARVSRARAPKPLPHEKSTVCIR